MMTKPAGAEYVCVVREPTREMTMAACGVLPSVEGVSGHAGKLCAEVYRTMLAASPRPAPDAGVIERLAKDLCASHPDTPAWEDQSDGGKEAYRDDVRAVLSSLAPPTPAGMAKLEYDKEHRTIVAVLESGKRYFLSSAPPTPAGSGPEVRFKLGFASFQDDTFELIARNEQLGDEITLHGKLTPEQSIEKIQSVLPTCVYVSAAGLLKGADSGDAGKMRWKTKHDDEGSWFICRADNDEVIAAAVSVFGASAIVRAHNEALALPGSSAGRNPPEQEYEFTFENVAQVSEKKLTGKEIARYIWWRAHWKQDCFLQDIAELIINERRAAVERFKSTLPASDVQSQDVAGMREACARVAENWANSTGINEAETGGQQIAAVCIAAEIRALR